MRRLTALLSAAALLVAVPVAVAGAQEDLGTLSIDTVHVDGHPEVEAAVTAPGGLDIEEVDTAFRILEDGEERPFEGQLVASSDVHVILIVDSSGSMGGRPGELGGPPIDAARDAAGRFLEQLPDDVQVAVHAYDTRPAALTDFDAPRDEHLEAVEDLQAGGETALYDAALMALDSFPETDGNGHGALVLLTDGEDPGGDATRSTNTSEATLDEAVERLAEAGVPLHGVEYESSDLENESLRAMVAASDGTVHTTDDADTLSDIYEQLATDLLNRYTLRYESEGSGTVELTVELEADGETLTASRTIELPEGEEATEAEEAAVPPPPTSADSGRSLLSTAGLAVGAALWFVALAIIALALFVPGERRAQIAGAAHHGGNRGLTEVTDRVTLVADRALNRRGYQQALNTALERAGIDLRPGEFVVLVGSGAVTALAVGVALNGWLLGILLAVVAVIVARLVVSFMAARRQAKFADQLSDTLQLLSGSLRAGYSILQAIDAVAREADSPTAEEFGRLVVETRLGRDLDDALEALAGRVDSQDFEWVMQAIEINREVGGDLAEVLDTVGETIRERDQIRRQVKALSAEGRLSAYVLLALPFGVGFMIYLGNPGYLAELTNGGLLGWGLIATGVVLMTVGVIWMRKLVKLVF